MASLACDNRTWPRGARVSKAQAPGNLPFETDEVHMFGRCVATLLLIGALFTLAGCNTVAGIGEDITGSARAVQRTL
jgi:predicted small secreted protein